MYGYFLIKNPILLDFDSWIYKYRALIILLSIIPIFLQIIQSGIYSTGMKYYVTERLNIVASDYYAVKNAIQNKDRNLIPPCYEKVFLDMAFLEPKEDIQLTKINECMMMQLIDIFGHISLLNLAVAYWQHPHMKKPDGNKPLADEKKSVNQATIFPEKN